VIISWHDEYVDCAVLAGLSPRAFRLRSNQYSWSHYRKPATFAYNWPSFPSHSTNISQITNPNAGGERASRTARSAFSSCHDTIRTPILNLRPSCRNRNMEPRSRFNLVKKPRFYVWSGLQPRQNRECWGVWRFLTQAWAFRSVPIQTKAG